MQPGTVNDGAQSDGGFGKGLGDGSLYDLFAGTAPIAMYEVHGDTGLNDRELFGEAFAYFAGWRQKITASGTAGEGMFFGFVHFIGRRAVDAVAPASILFGLSGTVCLGESRLHARRR